MVRSYTTTQTVHWDKDGCQFTAFKGFDLPAIQWDMDEKRFAAFKECIVRKDNDNPRYCFGTFTDGILRVKFNVSSAEERVAAGIDKNEHTCAWFYHCYCIGVDKGTPMGVGAFCRMLKIEDISNLDYSAFKERMEAVFKTRQRAV